MPKYRHAHDVKRTLNWFQFAWKLSKLPTVISDYPDTILYSSPSIIPFLGAQRLAKKIGARLTFEVRDIWPLTLTEIGGFSKNHPFIRFLQWIEDKAYNDSDAVVSNLQNAIEHMSGRGLDRDKFTWVSNGLSLAEVDLQTPLNAHVTRQLPQNKFIVGYTGTIGVANALGTLMDAAEMLRGYEDIAFVLVGAGKEEQALKSAAKTKSLENVFFIDPVPKAEIQAMLSKFSVCYIGFLNKPIYQYGIAANKIFEYLYSGKPTISAYSGVCDPVADANAGIQVPAEDAKKLADAVLQLYQMSPKDRALLGNNGRKAALEKYDYSLLASKLAVVLFNK